MSVIEQAVVDLLREARRPLTAAAINQLYKEKYQADIPFALAGCDNLQSFLSQQCYRKILEIHDSEDESVDPLYVARSIKQGANGRAKQQTDSSRNHGERLSTNQEKYSPSKDGRRELRDAIVSLSKSGSANVAWEDLRKAYKKRTQRNLTTEELNKICGTQGETRNVLLHTRLDDIIDVVDATNKVVRLARSSRLMSSKDGSVKFVPVPLSKEDIIEILQESGKLSDSIYEVKAEFVKAVQQLGGENVDLIEVVKLVRSRVSDDTLQRALERIAPRALGRLLSIRFEDVFAINMGTNSQEENISISLLDNSRSVAPISEMERAPALKEYICERLVQLLRNGFLRSIPIEKIGEVLHEFQALSVDPVSEYGVSWPELAEIWIRDGVFDCIDGHLVLPEAVESILSEILAKPEVNMESAAERSAEEYSTPNSHFSTDYDSFQTAVASYEVEQKNPSTSATPEEKSESSGVAVDGDCDAAYSPSERNGWDLDDAMITEAPLALCSSNINIGVCIFESLIPDAGGDAGSFVEAGLEPSTVSDAKLLEDDMVSDEVFPSDDFQETENSGVIGLSSFPAISADYYNCCSDDGKSLPVYCGEEEPLSEEDQEKGIIKVASIGKSTLEAIKEDDEDAATSISLDFTQSDSSVDECALGITITTRLKLEDSVLPVDIMAAEALDGQSTTNNIGGKSTGIDLGEEASGFAFCSQPTLTDGTDFLVEKLSCDEKMEEAELEDNGNEKQLACSNKEEGYSGEREGADKRRRQKFAIAGRTFQCCCLV